MLGCGVAAAVAGCSRGGADGDDRGTDTTTFATAVSAPLATLNPIYVAGSGAGNALARVLDQGYAFDESGEYVPLLYDMSTENGETWTFEVRRGLRFSDPYGEVTASDFAYLIREVHQSEWADSPAAESWRGVTVTETGEYEFRATLDAPRLLWPESYDPLVYPIPRELLEPYVDAEDAEGLRRDEELTELRFTGNLGPYVLEEWRRGEGVRYDRNDDYYLRNADGLGRGDLPEAFAEAPHFDAASIRVLAERDARLSALEAGEIDSAAIPLERLGTYRDAEEIRVDRIPSSRAERIAVNMRDNGWTAGPGNLFRYREFRQAMASAVDKEGLIDEVFRGFAEPNFAWQPPFGEFHPPEGDVPTFGVSDRYGGDYARDLARAAFDRSAHEYAFDGEDMVGPDGDRVRLDLYRDADREPNRRVAEFVAGELGSNLGIDVSVEAVDRTQFEAEYYATTDFPTPTRNDAGEVTDLPDALADEVNGDTVEWTRPTAANPGPRSVTSAEDWDMEVAFGSNTFPRNPLSNAAFFDGATAPHNAVGYYPEFDATSLFDRARRADRRELLADALAELFASVAAEQPYVTLAFPDGAVGYRDGLTGPIESFSNGWDLPAWRYE
ncbi:ABC transporter substrate-binding protein [Halorubrum trueperi]